MTDALHHTLPSSPKFIGMQSLLLFFLAFMVSYSLFSPVWLIAIYLEDTWLPHDQTPEGNMFAFAVLWFLCGFCRLKIKQLDCATAFFVEIWTLGGQSHPPMNPTPIAMLLHCQQQIVSTASMKKGWLSHLARPASDTSFGSVFLWWFSATVCCDSLSCRSVSVKGCGSTETWAQILAILSTI